jgi:hypothetical protein
MVVRGRNRIYPCLLVIGLMIAGMTPEAQSQKRVYNRVEPNQDSVNRTAEIYSPTSGTFSGITASMAAARQGHTATLLLDGNVMLAGGYNGAFLSGAELFRPGSGTFSGTSSMSYARRGHTATLLQSGKVLIVGGFNGSSYLTAVELFEASGATFSTPSATLATGRTFHTATRLSDGKVLVVGGFDGSSYLTSAEIYDPSAGTIALASGSLSYGRASHSATLMSDGKVLIAGGYNSEGVLKSAEVYDPSTGKFTVLAGSMTGERYSHTATVLSDGRVLYAGGYNTAELKTAEIYSPSAGTFAATTGTMTAPRNGHTAALLPDGKVLIAGGYNGQFLATAEVFDPSAGSFTARPTGMTTPRQLAQATVLSNGSILLTGGQKAKLLVFDVNIASTDNVSPNIIMSSDSKTGWVAYTGSGTVVAFSPQTGEILKRIETGGYPSFGTVLGAGSTIAWVSAMENKIFLIDTASRTLAKTYTFDKATFGFGSRLILSADGTTGYISSTGTGEVIKFTIADGKEQARQTSLQTPAQVTLSKDGATLMVVDTSTEQISLVDPSTMKQKGVVKPSDKLSTANLTISNNIVNAPNGTDALISCQDSSGGNGVAILFKISTGEILASPALGTSPGFAAMSPANQYWVILGDLTLSRIPVWDPNSIQNFGTAKGAPLGSANIAFSPDSHYAFYVASDSDVVYQQDLDTGGVIHEIQVGDEPNKALDQPSSVAMTPDGTILTVVDFMSNRLELLGDVTKLEAPMFNVTADQFTGLSMVNLSNATANLTLWLIDNYGSAITGTDLTNPVNISLAANQQVSKNLTEIFNLDTSNENVGRLQVYSDNPKVAGYLSMGKIAATWFGYYLRRMDGAPLFSGELYDWIAPELFPSSDWTVKLDVTSTNYTQETFDVYHYSKDGSAKGQKSGTIAYPTNRQEYSFSDLFTSPSASKVLIAGGVNAGTAMTYADAYDPSLDTLAATGAMVVARQGHTATQTLAGKVLIAGGKNTVVLSSAENYDPVTGAFISSASTMNAQRYRHSATLLASGKVLLAGGQNSSSVNTSAEIYDSSADTFTATTGSMTTARESHTATRLVNGKVLIAGGVNGSTYISACDLYDPTTDTFTATGSMANSRTFHTATLLNDGRVLIAGGYNGTTYLNTAEIYNPVTGTFSTLASTMSSARDLHTATLLNSGKVLIAGGLNSSATLNMVELFNPTTNAFEPVSSLMSTPRNLHTASLLPDGKVFIAGGQNASADLITTEYFDPETLSFTSAPSMSYVRSGHAALLLSTGSDGYLRFTAKQGLIFGAYFQQSHDNGILNGIEAGKYAGVQKLYASQYANAPAFKTKLNLINTNPSSDALVTIRLHAADGKVIGSPVTRAIPVNGKLREDLRDLFHNDPAIENTSGWLEIDSTADRVLGTITFTDDEEIFLVAQELSGKAQKDVVFPLAAEDSQYLTAIALLNANDSPANVTVELWKPDGTKLRSSSLTLAPGTRIAQYLVGYFQGLGPILAGNIRIHSTLPLHMMSIVHDWDLNFMAPNSAIPIP